MISKRFAMEGFTVHVGAKGSGKMQHLYHKKMHFSQGFGEGDDIHLVMEFKVCMFYVNSEVKPVCLDTTPRGTVDQELKLLTMHLVAG